MPRPEHPGTADAVDLLAAAHPVAAFADAHRHGRLLALRTSGTAASPRTIVRTTASWVDSFPHVSALLDLGPASRVWVPGPLTATMNLFAAAHAAWVGATLVDAPDDATHAHLTPAALARQLAGRPDSLRGVHVLVAGDRLERTTYDAARAAGARVSHYYGAAELSFVAWGEHADALRPFPDVEVQERDGELWVRSPYTCVGYQEAGRVLHRDGAGWTTVGDRGTVADGRVRVLGRGGGITTGGATVLVADVEDALRARAAGEVVVVGAPHPDLGEVVVAVVTRADDVPVLTAHARETLSPPERPRRWLHVATLPVTVGGKVDRVALATMVAPEPAP
jgi:long-chain acyl-CoA synthetase